MRTQLGFTLLIVALLASADASAQQKQRVCDLLTAEDVAGTLGVKPEPSLDHEEVIQDGAWKGETQRRCNWPLGPGGSGGNLYVIVVPSRNDAQRKAAADGLEAAMTQFKSQGWTVAKTVIGNATCGVGTPPATLKVVAGAVTCLSEVKGNGVSAAVVSTAIKVTPESVKSLLDRAASRLR